MGVNQKITQIQRMLADSSFAFFFCFSLVYGVNLRNSDGPTGDTQEWSPAGNFLDN